MRLYANHCKTFIEDCERNQIAEKLCTSFQLYAKNPSPGEFLSWQNSLRALALIFSRAGLTNRGVMLEFQLPTNSKRIDRLLCGFAKDGTPRAVANGYVNAHADSVDVLVSCDACPSESVSKRLCLKSSDEICALFCCSSSARRCCTTLDNARKYIGCLTT